MGNHVENDAVLERRFWRTGVALLLLFVVCGVIAIVGGPAAFGVLMCAFMLLALASAMFRVPMPAFLSKLLG